MPVTGVYFVPSSTNSPTSMGTIVEKFRIAYDPAFVGRWALEHRLLRDTPSCLPPSAYAPLPPVQPRFMQFLSLSHYPTHGFIYTTDRPNPDPWDPYLNDGATGHHPSGGSSVSRSTPAQSPPPPPTAASTNQQQQQQALAQQGANTQNSTTQPSRTMMTTDLPSFTSFYSMTQHACEPLWCHRHTLAVPSGMTFEVSDFRVRIGEVRQTSPVTRVRGTVIEIEYRGPSSNGQLANVSTLHEKQQQASSLSNGAFIPHFENTVSDGAGDDDIVSDEDWEIGEILIREFWERCAVSGAKEAIRVHDVGRESREAIKAGKKTLRGKDGRNTVAGVDLARQYMEVFRLNR